MKTKLKFLTKMSLNRKIKTKWFPIINIILLIFIVTLVNIDSIISFFGGDFDKETNIYVLNNSDYETFNILENSFETNMEFFQSNINVKLNETEKTEEELIEKIEDNKTLILVLENNEENYIKAKLISESYLDSILNQILIASINSTKSIIAMSELNIDMEELVKMNLPVELEKSFIDETKSESEENMEMIMSIVFPILILPMFMLVIFLVQMIGTEINEEKTTRGMEIIISNVSPKVHFFSKILASNIFVLIQGLLLFIFAFVGIKIRNLITNKSLSDNFESLGINMSDILEKLNETNFFDKLIYIIPLTLILITLSFLAYSLFAGILASMTTNMEDFQQIQAPLMIVLLSGYYLSIMAAMFQGSVFIQIASYIPFISALLSPALLVINQVGITDVLISISVLIIFNFLLIKYGLRIYKVGILNYSSDKLFRKMFKSIKQK